MSPPAASDAPAGRASASRTGLAFLLSPGLAALPGPAALDPSGLWIASGVQIYPFVALCFAVVGYATAMTLAVPLYIVLPERVRGSVAAVVPLAGAVAATPWLALPLASDWAHPNFGLAPLAFGLGCVAGVAFSLIRDGWPGRRHAASAPEAGP